MKVMEKGRPQKGWSTEAVCTGKGNGDGGCGAKLLVEQADIYRTASHCRDETDYYETFQCPECGVETDLKGVPSSVVTVLPSKAVWIRSSRTRKAMTLTEAIEHADERGRGLDACAADHRQLAAWLRELQAVRSERDELQRVFDLRWEADMRAIRRWQEAHPGNDHVWPDHADLVVWLMGQLGGD